MGEGVRGDLGTDGPGVEMVMPRYTQRMRYTQRELLEADIADLETDLRCAERDGRCASAAWLAYAEEVRRQLAQKRVELEALGEAKTS